MAAAALAGPVINPQLTETLTPPLWILLGAFAVGLHLIVRTILWTLEDR